MPMLNKLSPNTEKLADVLYKSYTLSNGKTDFSSFSHLGMNEKQLLACFSELEEYGLAILEEDDAGYPFLNIQPELLTYKYTGKLRKIL